MSNAATRSAADCADLDDAAIARLIGEAGSHTRAEAEAELCRRFARRIRLYGLRHLRDAHAAADLVQQVLLTTIEGLREGKIRQPEQIASFILGTCRMTVLDQRRTATRRTRLLDTFAEDVPIADVALAPSLDRDRLRHCLERLSESERSVLVMTFYDDQPGSTIARELALSEANVRVIRHRGLQRLRACMDA